MERKGDVVLILQGPGSTKAVVKGTLGTVSGSMLTRCCLTQESDERPLESNNSEGREVVG